MSGLGMRKRLRELLASGEPHVMVGTFNAQCAIIAERAGFQVVGAAGYGIAATLLGEPDIGLTTCTEAVQIAGYIVDAVNVPVIADADTGFGNALNAMRTTEQFMKAGAAAIHIEDQVSPKRCGHVAGKQVIPLREAVGKFRAAARVRAELDPDFVLIARCDARGVQGGTMQDTLERGLAYLEAGADVFFPEGLVDEGEIAEVCAKIEAPIMYNRTGISPNLPVSELRKYGRIALVNNGNGAMRAAARAMWDYLHALRVQDASLDDELKIALANHPLADFHSFVGFPAARKLEEEFLPPDEMLARYPGSLGFLP
jgi:2-methylisocitrate lyase-like PEP mutase family enzyme